MASDKFAVGEGPLGTSKPSASRSFCDHLMMKSDQTNGDFLARSRA